MDTSLQAAREHFLEGVRLSEAGDDVRAEQAFAAALALAPGRVSVLVNLAATRLRLGRAGDALQAADEALANADDAADAWGLRGRALAALQRFDEALAAFDRALALDAADAVSAYHRARVLVGLRRLHEALAALEAPAHAAGWRLRGQVLRMLDRHEDALPTLQRAVELDAEDGAAWSHLGQLLADLGRVDEAAAAFEQAIAHGVDPAIDRWFLAALGRTQAPAAAPEGYVRALFDGYAGDFEAHLLDVLRYRGHEAVASAARAASTGTVASALDLGCGTGLCGQLLRPWVGRLEGVDLSATMIAAARRCGAYDELHHAELVAHLRATPRRHDLLVCADTFIYLGDLDAAFGAAAHVLRPGGVLVFSVERGDDTRGFALTRERRYVHGEDYLRALAQRHGYAWEAARPVVLREEQRRPVAGLVVTLRRS